jgi:hypothetical protein
MSDVLNRKQEQRNTRMQHLVTAEDDRLPYMALPYSNGQDGATKNIAEQPLWDKQV